MNLPSPSAQQQDILNAVANRTPGQNFTINAVAGSGKTTTLKMIAAQETDAKFIITAFNRKIVNDIQKSMAEFKERVTVKTYHSLAFASHGRKLIKRINNSPRINAMDLAKNIGVHDLDLGGEKNYDMRFLASLVQRGITKYCSSDDVEITGQHVGRVDNLDADGEWTNHHIVWNYLDPFMKWAWEDVQQPYSDSGLRCTHEVYLKQWCLTNPQLNCDFFCYDEAQDTSPNMKGVAHNQKNCCVVMVGDMQQSIYGFRNAVNAMKDLPNATRFDLTDSHRFGPEIANVVNSILDRIPSADVRVNGVGPEGTVGILDSPRAILVRTNGGAVGEILDALTIGRKPFLVGGDEKASKEKRYKDITSFCYGAISLKKGKRPKYCPELQAFKDWDEVLDYVQNDPNGTEIAMMVNLIERNGASTIINALKECTDTEDEADVVVATVHKTKGWECESVQLSGDFGKMITKEGKPRQMTDEDWRVLYVAVTRGKVGLDISRCELLSFVGGMSQVWNGDDTEDEEEV